jgi:hypothetical protein
MMAFLQTCRGLGHPRDVPTGRCCSYLQEQLKPDDGVRDGPLDSPGGRTPTLRPSELQHSEYPGEHVQENSLAIS